MKMYKDVDGESGVRSYEYGADWITVEFERGRQRQYKYTYASAGSLHVERMKVLADHGEGLSAYINKNLGKSYAQKW